MKNKVTRILFVCLGNICRSPMAEFMFKEKIRKLKLEDEFEIESAGTSAEEQGNDMYPQAKDILRKGRTFPKASGTPAFQGRLPQI